MKLSKRNFLWIIPIAIIGLFFWVYGPQDDITDNEYIKYVKNYKLIANNDTPLEQVMEKSCKKPYWVYFESQGGQSVVEFQGNCPVDQKTGDIKLQFLVNEEMTEVKPGGMLLNGTEVKKEKKDQFIETLSATSS